MTVPEKRVPDWFRTRHEVKRDHFDYKAFLLEAGLSDETSSDSPLSLVTSSEEDEEPLCSGSEDKKKRRTSDEKVSKKDGHEQESPSACSTPRSSASASGGASTDWSSVSKMLGYLKYHAREANTDASDKEAAQYALAKYSSLSGIDKQDFLAQYIKHKGNLKWARTFSTRAVEKTKMKAKKQEAPTKSCVSMWASPSPRRPTIFVINV
jgi:hypothetical protein